MGPIQFTFTNPDKNSSARLGVLKTPHGDIQTPAFAVVGTKATVKGLTPQVLKETGAQVFLANTYHLYLQPGHDIIKSSGGLHKFVKWDGPMITDSGGFQVFSLGAAYGKGISKFAKGEELLLPESKEDVVMQIATIDPSGVTFKSHIDGSTHYFTPEKSIEIQHALGADIIFAFDECTSPHESLHYQKEALERTHRWAKQCLKYHQSKEESKKQALFAVVQGGRDETLRKESAEFLGSLDFDGYGIGGSFGKEDIGTSVKWVNEILPKEKPRHLLGIGEPDDILSGVEHGCDLFDCVIPTRLGRTGSLFTLDGKINIFNTVFQNDSSPIDSTCDCYTCKNFCRSYLAHLFRAKEMLGGVLASTHNVRFINKLFEDIRLHLKEGTFGEFKYNFIARFYKK